MFIYHVTYWDDTIRKEEKTYGVINADSYNEATEYVCDYYGATSIEYMSLEQTLSETIIEVDELNEYFKGENINEQNQSAYSTNDEPRCS